MIQLSKLPLLDYDDPVYHTDPFTWLADRALECRVARSRRGIEVLEYQLVRKMLLHKSLGTDHANLVNSMEIPESRALEFKRNMLLTHNRGDTRRRLRKVLTGLLGPGPAEQMRSQISKTVTHLLDALPSGKVDLKHQFTDLVPASVYCGWVDAPFSDARFVADMSETVLSIFQRDPSLTPKIVAAYDELFSYARARLAEREASPSDDFLSRLISARNQGDLSTSELEDFAVMLIEASTDNTTHQIAIALDRLTSMPDVWQRIAQDPSLVPNAVREVMRLWPRSISTSRTALEDTEINGIEIPKGTSLFASFGACHRQADIFTNPHKFDLTRQSAPSHLNFGGGPFSCLGQFVATIEVEECISQMAVRYPKLKFRAVKREYTAMFQSIDNLTPELLA